MIGYNYSAWSSAKREKEDTGLIFCIKDCVSGYKIVYRYLLLRLHMHVFRVYMCLVGRKLPFCFVYLHV